MAPRQLGVHHVHVFDGARGLSCARAAWRTKKRVRTCCNPRQGRAGLTAGRGRVGRMLLVNAARAAGDAAAAARELGAVLASMDAVVGVPTPELGNLLALQARPVSNQGCRGVCVCA